MKKLFYLLFLGLGLVACEKIIEVDVDEADQQIVIEAVLNDRLGESYVKISKTGTIYEDTDFEVISGATVTVTDQSATVYTFTESMPGSGIYELPTFQTVGNNNYNLNVTIDGVEYTATSKTYTKPVLDSLTYLVQFGGFGGQGADTSYLVFYNFVDFEGEENHYRIKAWVNGKADELYYITNDELFNGQPYSAPFFGNEVLQGDTVFAELLAIDEAYYRYLFVLSNNADSGPFSAAPANPPTNIEGGAIGYFGAFTTDTLTLFIP